MTVRELIEKLQSLTPEQQEYTVTSEGCDCDGAVAAVEIVEALDVPYVYLRRHPVG
jgi:hypothetical protein